MAQHAEHSERHSNALHPRITVLIVVMVLWFAVAVWGFALDRYADYLLAVVSGLILMALAIPYALWRQNRRVRGDRRAPPESLRDWASGEFDTWQDHVKAKNAAAEIMLPIAAAAAGMTIFGIVFHLVARSVG